MKRARLSWFQLKTGQAWVMQGLVTRSRREDKPIFGSRRRSLGSHAGPGVDGERCK